MLEIITHYSPITLDEMSGIRLMNRTDTKFVTTVPMLRKLLTMAASEYRAQEIDGVRIAPYYTLYFDTPDCEMYCVHQHGHTNRQKLRIRSYVQSGLNFLEVKTKNNHGRTKKKRTDMLNFDPLHPDANIQFRAQDDIYKGYNNFMHEYLHYDPTTLTGQLENHFNRITLVNKKKTERLTIDTALQFHNYVTGNDVSLDNIAIIELKRDGLQPSPILGMLRQLRIKPMGFSKYCMGSAMTNEHLPLNRFKLRLRKIDKLQNI